MTIVGTSVVQAFISLQADFALGESIFLLFLFVLIFSAACLSIGQCVSYWSKSGCLVHQSAAAAAAAAM